MIEALIGKQVGKYRLNTGFVHHDANFETASWWEDTGIEPGIYPIFVARNQFDYRNPIGLQITYTGKIVADFFPSSFGGVMFGRCDSRRIGHPRTIKTSLDWKTAIARTGNSPSREGSPDIFVDYTYWPAITDYLRKRLETDLAHFAKTDLFAKNETDRVSSLKIRSGWISESAENLEEILRATDRHEEEYFARLHEANTAWAREETALAA